MKRSVLRVVACAAFIGSVNTVHAGPCTAQIAAVERQIQRTPPSPETGPTGPQTLGAQLHYQPTPGDVAHAEHAANKEADAALDHARTTDAAGDAAGCNAALDQAKRLYGIDQ